MTITRRAALGSSLAAALGLLGLATVGLAQRGQPRSALVNADQKRLQPEDAQGSVLVFGDPSKPGMYIQRNRFGPGQTSRPHFHDQDRWVTVIKGTWYTGEGDVFQPDKMVPIREGGLMYHPAGFHHYDGAKPGGDEEVIVQIMGMGPVTTTQTEVDANGQPVSRGGR